MNQFEFFFRIKSYRAAYSSSQTSSYLTVWQGRKLSKDYNQRNKIKKAACSFTFFSSSDSVKKKRKILLSNVWLITRHGRVYGARLYVLKYRRESTVLLPIMRVLLGGCHDRRWRCRKEMNLFSFLTWKLCHPAQKTTNETQFFFSGIKTCPPLLLSRAPAIYIRPPTCTHLIICKFTV